MRTAKSGTAGEAIGARSFTAVSGKVNVEASVMVSNTTIWNNALYAYDSSGHIAASITIRNGNLNIYNGSTETTVQAVSASAWYYIKLVMNPATDTFDLYVNGTLKSSGVALRQAGTDIAKLQFGIGTSYMGTLNVDNVVVYKY